MNFQEILNWLKETDNKNLAKLWQTANETRKKYVGDEVHLRGLIEISNYCVRNCGYCGINRSNQKIERYRMTPEEITASAKKAAQLGYGTVVIQSGEDYGITTEWIAAIIRTIKKETSLAVTLSLGERKDEELKLWKEAGADRYLLRFETSDKKLYAAIHPPLLKANPKRTRLTILKKLKTLGYEIGSGVMLGIPGQSYESLAQDILLFRELDLDMVGVGPYIAHPLTTLGAQKMIGAENQAPNTELMTYKVIALTRILCPDINIPSTTALATLNKAKGRELGLNRGANVVMPNLTPLQYRVKYEIYPNKACIYESPEDCNQCLKMRIELLGRTVGKGTGSRKSN